MAWNRVESNTTLFMVLLKFSQYRSRLHIFKRSNTPCTVRDIILKWIILIKLKPTLIWYCHSKVVNGVLILDGTMNTQILKSSN
ncbi:hypothetical protein [Candidatus Hodgkinia cicadicola]|uniref:hypothetical protein n=1 Tax=Candidatus Hodgkinia cicadicola TaxID=573658 RepID=UPI0011BA5770